MKPIDWDLVPESGVLILLTAYDIYDGQPMMLADFRDQQALFHIKYQRYLGLSLTRGIRFCRPPAIMSNGYWYAEEDNNISDVKLKIDNLSLECIK